MDKESGALILLSLFIFIHQPDNCSSVPQLQVCMDLVPSGYEIHQPPSPDGKSTKIFTWVQILDFGDINQSEMDYLLHAFVIHVWNDSRLLVNQYKGKKVETVLHEKCQEYVWIPSLFYETAKDVKSDQSHLPASEFKILPDGAVYISTKFIFRAFCPMQLQHYPFDTQTCLFKISMLTPNVLTELQWIGGPDSPYKDKRTSVEVYNEPRLLLFYFKEPINESIVELYTEGEYTTLIIKFSITRQLTGSILNVFIPSTMIVVMSWVGFWLGVEHVPARVALSITSLLTLFTQVHQYRAELPPANYIKAMDIWLFVCISIVFSTLVEFALSYNNQQKQLIKHDAETISTTGMKTIEKENVVNSCCWATNSVNSRGKRKIFGISCEKKLIQGKCNPKDSRIDLSNKTDEICRILYPTSFFIFVITYWLYYLNIYEK